MSHEDDNAFANNPIEESLNPSVDKEKKTNKFLDKLKILDHRKTEVRTLSESDKRHLTSKCTVLIEDKLKEINNLSYQKTKLEQENTALKETLQGLKRQLQIEKDLKSTNQSVIEQQLADIDKLHRTINRHQETKEELENEIKSVNKTYTTKCQEFIEQKEEFEKANIRVQNLESELADVKHELVVEKKYRNEDLEKFHIETSHLKEELEYLQLKYNQEIQYHGTEVQDILSNFALEKESLICDFTEEHKTEILGIQNKTRRRESILLKEHTEKVEQLENEVQRLQHELRTNIENNIQIEQNPIANNKTDSEDSEISDIDLEINGEEQIEPININLENIADPENLEFEVIENMAQNRMDLLKYMPKFEGGGKDKDSAAEHVRAFKDYLAIHEVRIVAEGADEPDWELIYKRFGYSLLGLAKNWFEDRKFATQAEAYNENKFNNMIEAFKREFSRYGSTRVEKNIAWEMLRWDPKTERLDSFMRRIQELADDLGKDAEDIRNAFVKAMPAHVIPSIAALDNLEQMAACVKRLLGYLQLNPSTGVTPDLQTFMADQNFGYRAESRVDFNPTNLLTFSIDKLGEKLDKTHDRFDEKFMKMEDELSYVRRDMERMRLRDRSNSRGRGRYRSQSRDKSRSRGRNRSRDRSRGRTNAKILDEVYQMIRTGNRDQSRSFRDRDRQIDRSRERNRYDNRGKNFDHRNTRDNRNRFDRSNSRDTRNRFD